MVPRRRRPPTQQHARRQSQRTQPECGGETVPELRVYFSFLDVERPPAPHRRFSISPKYQHKDLYVTITEKHIMETFPFKPNTSPATRASFSSFSINSVRAHAGELLYHLFIAGSAELLIGTCCIQATSCLLRFRHVQGQEQDPQVGSDCYTQQGRWSNRSVVWD